MFDVAQHWRVSDDKHSMLVNNEHLGNALAAGFNPSSVLSKTTNLIKNFVTSQPATVPDFPTSPTVLMRGHGFTCVGSSIEEAVYRAVFTCSNARVQTTALLMQGSYNVSLVGARFGGWEKETGK